MWIYRFAVVAVICMMCRETYSLELEEFLSSLSSKKEDFDDDEVQEAPEVNQEELLQLIKRSGLLAQPEQKSSPNDAIDNQKLLQMIQELQTINKQQNQAAYSPVYAQASTVSASQRSATESTQYPVSSYSASQDQQNYISSTQQRSPAKYSPQYIDSAAQIPSSSIKIGNSLYNSQQERNTKPTVKDDRQGHYPYESHAHDSGYAHQPRSYAHESYAHHEPVHQHKLSLPIPQIALKFDPLRILKLLLSGLPRPLFNLNGKIFLGIELGKGGGLAAGGGGYHGGRSNLITIG